jgi:hypothetical protein
MRMDQPARAAMQRLTPLVGEWSMTASLGPTGVVGRAVFAWAVDGAFLIQRAQIPEAPESIVVMGLAANGDYTQHYFDSRGIARVYAMTFGDGVWTLLREAPDFTPLSFAQRFVGRFSADGDTIDGRWEKASDGSDWQLDFELTYTRAT